MRRAVMARPARLIRHAAARVRVAALAGILEHRVRRRDRSVHQRPAPGAEAGDERNRRAGADRHQHPRQSPLEQREQRWPLEIVQVEPLGYALGIADAALVFERFLFLRHLNPSTTAPRAPRPAPAARTKAARAPAATRTATDAAAAA